MDADRPQLAWLNGVSPDFFRTLGIPLLRGRTFLPAESASGRILPVVVSRHLARALWKEGDPLGSSLRGQDGRRFEVVGIAGDVGHPERSTLPALYSPLPPVPAAVLVRFSGDATSAVARVEAGVRRAAPAVFAAAATFHADDDEEASKAGRFARVVLAVAGCALAIALMGIYGTVGFALRRRAREVDIRMALGARGRDVVRALVTPTGKGVAAGLLLGLATAYLMVPALNTVSSTLGFRDPLVFVVAVLALGAAALAAMVRPVLRALALGRIWSSPRPARGLGPSRLTHEASAPTGAIRPSLIVPSTVRKVGGCACGGRRERGRAHALRLPPAGRGHPRQPVRQAGGPPGGRRRRGRGPGSRSGRPTPSPVEVVGDWNDWQPGRVPLEPVAATGVWQGFARGVGPGNATSTASARATAATRWTRPIPSPSPASPRPPPPR